jgi:hypothetical protein
MIFFSEIFEVIVDSAKPLLYIPNFARGLSYKIYTWQHGILARIIIAGAVVDPLTSIPMMVGSVPAAGSSSR